MKQSTICIVKFFNNQNTMNTYIREVRLLLFPVGLFEDGGSLNGFKIIKSPTPC